MAKEPHISVREMELFILIGRHGATKAQAANAMCISPHTVKRHLARVAKRIGSINTANALNILIQTDVVPVEPYPRRVQLTPEQKVILEEIAKGFPNPEIAARTGMTLAQTQYAVKLLFKALRVNTRIHAVYRGHQTGHLTTNRRHQ